MPRLNGLTWRGSRDPRLLILGSFPSEASLAQGRYYGHPRNHFWGLVGATLGLDMPDNYEDRITRLSEAGIALWDVISSCERSGSLDSAIRGEEANDLESFLADHASVERVALNGGKAADSFRRFVAPEIPAAALPVGRPYAWKPPRLAGRTILLCRLPSSSPIPTRDYREASDKIVAWSSFLSPACVVRDGPGPH